MPASIPEPRTTQNRLPFLESRSRPLALAIAITFLLNLHPVVGLAEDPPPSLSFLDVTASAGLREPLAGLMGHGAAWGDVDADGRLDLFVGGFCDRPDAEYQPAPGPVPSRLLLQTPDGRFESTGQTAVEFFGRTSGAVFLDLDNDADLDLYVANNARSRSTRTEGLQRSAQLLQSRLFRNDRGLFSDITDSSRACPSALHSARNIGVLDFDNDGLLDLLVLEDRFVGPGQTPRSVLLRNRGDLTFEDANRSAHLPDNLHGLGLAIGDLNADHRPDFFVGHSNRLFLSTGGSSYREAVELSDVFDHHPTDAEDWPCGASFADLDLDGDLDLVVSTHHAPARNHVYLNDGLEAGIPRFRDVTTAVGLGDEVPVKCPHVEVQDFDNDGWPDIFFSAGWRQPDGSTMPLIFRNEGLRDGLPRFRPPRPIQPPMVYYPAAPSADFDRDGRLDLFLTNWFSDDHSHLLRNTSPIRHWLDVRVIGRSINRMGIGTRIEIFREGHLDQKAHLLGLREIATGYGYASGQPAVAHFGLGDHTQVDLRATLPDGQTLQRRSVQADQVLVLKAEP